MGLREKSFQELLSEAIHTIKKLEGKNIAIIHDEIGYALGLKGGSAVENWRKEQNNPPNLPTLQALAKIIYARTNKQLDEVWFEKFFSKAGHLLSTEMHQELFGSGKRNERLGSHTHTTKRLAEIKSAISLSDLEHARELLRQELIENPSHEAWYLASVLTQINHDPAKEAPISVKQGIGQVTGGNVIGPVTGDNAKVEQHIHPSSPERPIPELIELAHDSLNVANYNHTLEVCEKVFKQDPSHPLANILSAIALMRGGGTNELLPETATRVEAHLQRVTDTLPHTTIAWVILGLVKHDCYVWLGKDQKKPSIKEIKQNFEPKNITLTDWALINKAKFSPDAFRMLGLTKPDNDFS